MHIKVVDNSVAVKWLSQILENFTREADEILDDIRTKKVEIYMPELAKYELGNALLRKSKDESELKDFLTTFYKLPITFIQLDVPTALLAIEIANKHSITYYDAAYMALAIKYNAPLITDNYKHQGKSVPGLTVVQLKNYGV